MIQYPAPQSTPLGQYADGVTAEDQISTLQAALMAEWARVDPMSSVSRYPTSSIETFRDLAKAALTHLGIEWREVNRAGGDK